MRFTNPMALWLLLLLPFFVAIAWRHRNPLQKQRDTLGIFARCLLVTMLVLALAGLERTQQSDQLATLFLLDVSDSVSSQAKTASQSYIQAALETMERDDVAGIVIFGAEALVERSMISNPTWRGPTSIPVASHTDIASAIRLGITLFPENAARRMIILSDGAATLGDARQATQLAQANGIEISTLLLPAQSGNEVQLEELDVPATLYEGEEFDLAVTLNSNTPAQVPLQIFSRGQMVAQQLVDVQPGDNTFVLPLAAQESGFTSFQARIAPANDTLAQNNMLDAFSEVRGPLSLLVVANEPDQGESVVRALRQSGLAVEEMTPLQMPSDLAQLSHYRAVVLVNVPAPSLTLRQQALLKSYVRDLGHGLVVIGGDESYGPGGYFQTELEETLPVNMVIEDVERLPPMSMMMIIDKSGSMDVTENGTTKVELAKESIARALALLMPNDRIGVVAFSDSATWVVRPTRAANREEILSAVGSIRAEGGTDILDGLAMGGGSLLEESNEIRHIILLSDGIADPNGILALVEELADNQITTSVVAIGQDHSPLLADIVEQGGGRFHFTDSPEVIPQIFALETTLATRSYLVEEKFTPTLVGNSPILQGIGGLPQLNGYVATSPKLTAQIILEGSISGDPLLAQWQFGLGRAIAWTSDAKGQWAAEWIGWSDFARFWSQAVRWTIVESSRGLLETEVRLEGNEAVVRAEVRQPDGDFYNDLDMEVSLIAPDRTQQVVQLKQVGPGLYESRFLPEQTGTYLLNTTGREVDEVIANQTRGFVMAYSPEYGTTQIDQTLLPDLAAIGEGKVLSIDEPALAFDRSVTPVQTGTPLWPLCLFLASLLLPIDIALRRLIFDGASVKRLIAWLRRPFSQDHAESTVAGPSTASGLLKAKAERPSQLDMVDFDDRVVESVETVVEEIAQPDVEREVSTVRQLMRAKERRRGQ